MCLVNRFNKLLGQSNNSLYIRSKRERTYGNLEGSAWRTPRELLESTWRAFSPVPYPASQMYTRRTPYRRQIYASGTWRGGLLVATGPSWSSSALILCFVAVLHSTGRWPLVGPRGPRTRPPDGDFWLESGASHPRNPFTWIFRRPNWCGFGVFACIDDTIAFSVPVDVNFVQEDSLPSPVLVSHEDLGYGGLLWRRGPRISRFC